MEQLVIIRDKRFRPLISRDKIAARVKELVQEIKKDCGDDKPLFLAVLNGSFMFASDLLKEMKTDCEISFMKVTSYEGMSSSGQVKELIGAGHEVRDRLVIVLEDIVDSGRTVEHIRNDLVEKGAKKVMVATMLFKPEAFRTGTVPEYQGFTVGNDFVIGYGMDYDGAGRNLDEIYVLA